MGENSKHGTKFKRLALEVLCKKMMVQFLKRGRKRWRVLGLYNKQILFFTI